MNPDKTAYPECDANVKLLYVAATRALHELAVYHTGSLTPLIAKPVADTIKNTVFDAENMQPNRTKRTVTFTSVSSSQSLGIHDEEQNSDAGCNTHNTSPITQGTDKNVLTQTAADRPSESRYKAPAARRTSPYPAMPYTKAPTAPTKIVDYSNKIMCMSEYAFGSVPKMDVLKQNPNRMAAYPFRAVRRDGNSLLLESINATLRITPYASTMIRVSYCKAGAKIPEAKCIENRNSSDKWKFKDTPDTALLATSSLFLRIDKKNGLVSFCDKEKNVLLSEKLPGHVLETTKDRSLCFFDFDAGQKLYAYGASNRDHLPLNRVARYISFGKGRLKAPCVISDKGYGLAIRHDSTVLFNSIPTYGTFISLGDAQYFDYYFFTGDSDEELMKKYDWIRSKNKDAD